MAYGSELEYRVTKGDGLTLERAIKELTFWLEESRRLSYSTGGRSISRDRRHASEMVDKWDAKVKELSRGGKAIKGVTLCDP